MSSADADSKELSNIVFLGIDYHPIQTDNNPAHFDGLLTGSYDTYGWFNFDSDAEGVRRLDRQWVSAHALALVDAGGWKAAVDVWHKKVTPTSTNSREGASPSPVGAAQHSPEQASRHGTHGLFAAASNQF